ncbi:MAG TPA: ABC transporter substrate-binding protein [Stellaceae bacterium]|nr:ABC transporter substrate-binding protein [Stellaceae bacterium]
MAILAKGTIVARGMLMALALLASGATADADATLRVGKAIAGPFDFTPLDVGMTKGFFHEHGIAIDEVNFAGSAKLQQGLAASAIDIGLGSGPELAFVAKGNTDRGIAAFAGPPDGLVLIVRADLVIKTVTDLKGQKISVSTPGGLTDWMVREVARRQGWGPDGIDVVPLGTDSAQVATMLTGSTEGMASDVANAALLEQQGKARILLKFGDVVHDFINHVTYATDGMMKNRPDDLRAFLAAWYETIHWMRGHKDETIKIVAPVMEKPPEIAARAYDIVMPCMLDDGHFDPKGLATLARSFVEMKMLPAEPDMTKLYTEAFLPPATAAAK